MNKIIILAFAFGVLFTAGCSENFLEVRPKNQILEPEFVTNTAQLQEVLNGAYKALGDKNAFGGKYQIVSEIMSDNLAAAQINLNDDYKTLYARNTNLFLSPTRDICANFGKAIGRANYALEKVDEFGGAEKNRITGEAKFVRAIAHWQLIRTFGQPWGYSVDNSHLGMPLHTKFDKAPINRSTVNECYAFVEADLKAAIDLLPLSNRMYASKWSAKGALAQLYFQQNRYSEARVLADEIINSGMFSLDVNPARRFSDTLSSEAIFYIDANNNANTNFNFNGAENLVNSYKKLAGGTKVADLTLVATVWDIFEPFQTDLRKNQGISKEGSDYLCTKFKTGTNIYNPIIHLTEMLLISAECAGEAGETSIAVDRINLLRNRAMVPPISASTPENAIRAVREERRRELFAEGNRLQDLKRIGAATERGKTRAPEVGLRIRNAPWNCPGLCPQIPDNESSGVTGMVPNPEGGCN